MLFINFVIMISYFPNIFLVKMTPMIVLFSLTGLSGILCGILFGCIISDYKTSLFAGTLVGFHIIFLSGKIDRISFSSKIRILIILVYFITGFTWPLESLPKLFRCLPKFTVVTYFASVAVQNNVEKYFGFENYTVIIAIVSMIVWSVTFLVIALCIMKIRKFT